ncbi:MAG: helix-turn-helix domain-containing protein [Bacteroidales bacterium]|nr:helix-turn-helix domain-containing protein [Bacteroidales bacterium]MCF8343159.1 helix-turn-helix domain-containing protein [Bacteroidales bacterium]MCF8351084.1 helix-turn-helix domain-containing protein [Bacteroidales bacterium]MCF8376818.1 helix-turn-helix domain-containing protein [Bacteroidales bacterium]MCF8400725.1 helix-turn-helix domain-containing protein [Bacteroidales bacterium]
MIHDFITYTPMYVTLLWALALLISKPKDNRARFFLGVFMTAAFLLYLSHAVYFNKDESLYLYFDPLYIFTSLLVYPLYYIYIKMLTIDIRFKKKNMLLLLPAVFFGVAAAVVYLLMRAEERSEYIAFFLFRNQPEMLETQLQNLQRYLYYANRLVFSVQVIYFLVKGIKLVIRYNQQICNFYSNLESKTLVWVHLLLTSFVVTSMLSVLFNWIGKYYFLDSYLFLSIPSLIFSVLLFIIGLQGYMQNHSVKDLLLDEEKESISNHIESSKEQLKEKLLLLFEKEKIYRNRELKIVDLSRHLLTNRSYISRIINNDFESSFSDFVNKYRIAEVKELLRNETTLKYSLEYLSEQAGFGSLHSFIRVFKNSEGITPGKYRDQFINKA